MGISFIQILLQTRLVIYYILCLTCIKDHRIMKDEITEAKETVMRVNGVGEAGLGKCVVIGGGGYVGW